MKFKFTIHHHFQKDHLLLVPLKLLHHHHHHHQHHHHFLYIPKEIFFLQKVIYELHMLLLELIHYFIQDKLNRKLLPFLY